jgi:hypothetical protein
MVRNSCAIIYLDIVQFLLAAYPRQFIEIYWPSKYVLLFVRNDALQTKHSYRPV